MGQYFDKTLPGGIVSTLTLSLLLIAPAALAQIPYASGDEAGAAASFSSSLAEPQPVPGPDFSGAGAGGGQGAEAAGIRATRPFQSLAVGLNLGFAGIGVELATPINSKFNLRGGASFFQYSTSFVVDTVPIVGSLHLGSVRASLDWFPSAGSFHISPGIALYNRTAYNATIFIPGNQVVMLNDQAYTSDPADPIHGTADLQFGGKVAPRLTVGFGNVIRHHTTRFTFPVEFGVEYSSAPTAVFQLSGSSCDTPNDPASCGNINADPQTQQNIRQQQTDIVNELKPLRFFPIFSFGISYKFGH